MKKIKCLLLLYNYLKFVFERKGFDGVFFLFSEKISNGKVRVSSNYKVVKKVVEFFLSL